MINPFPQPGLPMIHHKPVCCGAIPIGIGIPLVLTSWIGISLYFASLSFMGKSPFYSYFNRIAMTVFGVLNTLFVVICLYGYSLHLFRRSLNSYRQYAKLLACCVAAIIIDMFVNFIVFCIKKPEFHSWCESTASDHLRSDFPNVFDTRIRQATVVFNCTKLFNVEAEFSFACTVFMLMVYVYWVSFIIKVSRNFVLRGPEIRMHPIMQPNLDEPSPKDIVLN